MIELDVFLTAFTYTERTSVLFVIKRDLSDLASHKELLDRLDRPFIAIIGVILDQRPKVLSKPHISICVILTTIRHLANIDAVQSTRLASVPCSLATRLFVSRRMHRTPSSMSKQEPINSSLTASAFSIRVS